MGITETEFTIEPARPSRGARSFSIDFGASKAEYVSIVPGPDGMEAVFDDPASVPLAHREMIERKLIEICLGTAQPGRYVICEIGP